MAGSGLNEGQGQGVRRRGIGWKKKRLDMPAKTFRAKYSGEAAGRRKENKRAAAGDGDQTQFPLRSARQRCGRLEKNSTEGLTSGGEDGNMVSSPHGNDTI